MARSRNDWNYSGGAIASNAAAIGKWVNIEDTDSIAFIVTLPTGSGSPTATFSADLSNDPLADKFNGSDSKLFQPVVTYPMTATQTAINPPGTDTAVAFEFLFAGAGTTTTPPMPRAKFMRFNYNRTAGGSATKNLIISMEQRGI